MRNSYRVGTIPGTSNARVTLRVLIRSWVGMDFAFVSAFEEKVYFVYSGTNELSECSNHPNAANFR